MSEQRREEKQSRASSFSHKALAQAAASAKGMPPIANTLRAILAIPPRMRCTLAVRGRLMHVAALLLRSRKLARLRYAS